MEKGPREKEPENRKNNSGKKKIKRSNNNVLISEAVILERVEIPLAFEVV